MKRIRKPTRMTLLAAVVVANVVAVFVTGNSSAARSAAGIAARAEPLPATLRGESYATLPATAQLVVEPVLTDLAKQIKACPDFSGNKFPGETLNVSLSLPPALNGTGQCGAARRNVRDRLHPTPPFDRGAPAAKPTPQGGRRRAPGGVATSGTAAGPRGQRPPRSALGVDIPCELLPGGCPDPIPGTGGTPGTPATQLKITGVNVKWGVFESVNGRPGRALARGVEFASPSEGLSSSFVMAPMHFAELTTSAPPSDPFVIVATVAVTADKTVLSVPPSTTQVTSAEVPIQVPLSLSALQVPKVFGLFLHRDYGGAAAIYLPHNSTLNKTTLPEGVRKLADIYNPLASRLNFVTWFGTYLAGLQSLQHAFALEHWDLKELKDHESNLNDDDFIHRSPLTSVNDTEVEDEASSMLLIGPPETSVQFFQDRNYEGMKFTAKTGAALVVLVPNFVTMASQPPGTITDKTFTGSKTPNDSLSSFKWLR